jgi:hypothetical protein
LNDEKKKIVILGCLFAGVITIGAMQFLGKKGAPPPVETKKTETATAQKVQLTGDTTATKDPQFANALAARDPFEAPADALPDLGSPAKPTNRPAPFPHHPESGGLKPFEPLPMPGSITSMRGGIGASASTRYSVVGIIQGVKPMAVVDDGAGNQKLVAVGGAIDGDTRLLGVDSSSISVISRGKVRRMSMGGNPVGN